MNAMQVLSSQPWAERLGWVLVHFVWQGLSIAFLYAAARGVLGRALNPKERYLIGCAALASMMAAPLVTWTLMLPLGAGPDAFFHTRSTAPTGSTTVAGSTITLPPSVADGLVRAWPGKYRSKPRSVGKAPLPPRCHLPMHAVA